MQFRGPRHTACKYSAELRTFRIMQPKTLSKRADTTLEIKYWKKRNEIYESRQIDTIDFGNLVERYKLVIN